MTNDQADDAFQALHSAQRQALLLFMDLRDAGDAANAANARLRADRLQNEIDNLINKELDEWKQGAEALIPQLSAASNDAQTAVDAVEQDVKNAQKIVSAIAALDKAVGIAMKFLG